MSSFREAKHALSVLRATSPSLEQGKFEIGIERIEGSWVIIINAHSNIVEEHIWPDEVEKVQVQVVNHPLPVIITGQNYSKGKINFG